MNKLQESAIFYKENILHNVFVLTLCNGRHIIIYPETRHFKHLTGVQHLNTPLIFEKDVKNSERFYKKCLNGYFQTEDFLSEDFLNASIEEQNLQKFNYEKWFFDKTNYFSEIFYVLNSNNKVIKFNKSKFPDSEYMKQDFTYFKFETTDELGKYIGIKQDNSNKDYFCFSTLIYEKNNPNKYLTNQSTLYLKEMIIIPKNEFTYKKQKYLENNILNIPSETYIKNLKKKLHHLFNEKKNKMEIDIKYSLDTYNISIINSNNELHLKNDKEIIKVYDYDIMLSDSKVIIDNIFDDILIDIFKTFKLTMKKTLNKFVLIIDSEGIYEIEISDITCKGIEEIAKNLNESL